MTSRCCGKERNFSCGLWEEVHFRLLNKVWGCRRKNTHRGSLLPQTWASPLKQLLTVVHMSADGFVRWTADYKHIPRPREKKKIFFREQQYWKSRPCLDFAGRWLHYETLLVWPRGLEMPTRTHGFFIVHTKSVNRLPSLPVSQSENLAPLCGCTWLQGLHSQVLHLRLLKILTKKL